MYKSLKDIIAILSQNEIGLDCTYVGKNYTKRDLIDDLLALKVNYSYSENYNILSVQMENDLIKQMENEVIFESVDADKFINIISKKRANLINRIIERDGAGCFYCGRFMSVGDITIEHLHAKTNGGSDKFYNLKIAHRKCNSDAGDKSIEEKKEMAVLIKSGFPELLKRRK